MEVYVSHLKTNGKVKLLEKLNDKNSTRKLTTSIVSKDPINAITKPATR